MVEKYCRAKDGNITRRTPFACYRHTPRPQWYVTRTLPVLICNTYIHNRIYCRQSRVPLMSQMKPVRALNLNTCISVSFMFRTSKLSLSFRIFKRNAVKIPPPISSSFIGSSSIFGNNQKPCNSPLCSFIRTSVTSVFADPNNVQNTVGTCKQIALPVLH